MVERITFGLYKSTQPSPRMIPLTPAASAVRKMVPRFPGSCRFSKIRYKKGRYIIVDNKQIMCIDIKIKLSRISNLCISKMPIIVSNKMNKNTIKHIRRKINLIILFIFLLFFCSCSNSSLAFSLICISFFNSSLTSFLISSSVLTLLFCNPLIKIII